MKRFISIFVVLFMVVGILHSEGYAYTSISDSEAYQMYSTSENLVVVDVRENYEYCPGHIPLAINYPLVSKVFSEEYHNLPKDVPIFVVCASGHRSGAAAEILDNNGYDTVYSLTGGMPKWYHDIVTCIVTMSGQSPLNTGYVWSYAPVAHPIRQQNPADCQPFAIGDLSTGNLNLQVGLPAFSSGVDVYLAIGFSDALFLVDSSNVLQFASGLSALPKWKINVSTAIDELLYGNMPTSLLPAGVYNLYIAVVPTGETDFSHLLFQGYVF